MKTTLLNLLLIGTTLISPIMAADLSFDAKTIRPSTSTSNFYLDETTTFEEMPPLQLEYSPDEINSLATEINTYNNHIDSMQFSLSHLKSQYELTPSEDLRLEIEERQEDLSVTEQLVNELLDNYLNLRDSQFDFQEASTTTKPVIAAGAPKDRTFSQQTTLYTAGSANPSPQSNSTVYADELRRNLEEELNNFKVLESLLTLPEYQDKASSETKRLHKMLQESISIIDYFKDCLTFSMYPNRSPESLMREAQQNCLGPVKLILHKDGYFHVPKPSWKPDKPRKRPCTSLERTPTFDDFSSCGLSNTPSENSSFVSEPLV